MEEKNYVTMPLQRYDELIYKAIKYDDFMDSVESGRFFQNYIKKVIDSKQQVLEECNDGYNRDLLNNDIRTLNELLKIKFE